MERIVNIVLLRQFLSKSVYKNQILLWKIEITRKNIKTKTHFFLLFSYLLNCSIIFSSNFSFCLCKPFSFSLYPYNVNEV